MAEKILPFTSLAGATSPGPGVVKHLEGAFSRHTIHAVETGSGTFSDISVRLQGSHDEENWIVLTSVTLTGTVEAVTATVDTHLVRYVRADVSADNFSGSPVITATIASGT